VRVHTDAAANTAARLLGARAFTIGPRIVFAAGQFEPHSKRGGRLLAHELPHSLQQRSGPPRIARSTDDWLRPSVNVAAPQAIRNHWNAGRHAQARALARDLQPSSRPFLARRLARWPAARPL
jgi:hypothetical protein